MAKYIREDISWLEDRAAALPPDAIHAFYTNLWGTSPSINIPFDRTMHADHHIPDKITGVITKKEFNNRFNRLKKGSAPGPDGITRKHITNLCVKEALRLFYNILLVCRFQPFAWSTNRTILIPKQGNDLERTENYRPLTIGSILGRIYWGIFDTRLRSYADFSHRQKGFVSEAGCFNNVHALAVLLRLAKARTGMVLIQLDISKAFDTIPHEAIEPALHKLGIPTVLRSSIVNSYTQMRTSIEHHGSAISIQLRRGVKQGDPLSPYIFNAIINPLLGQLENL